MKLRMKLSIDLKLLVMDSKEMLIKFYVYNYSYVIVVILILFTIRSQQSYKAYYLRGMLKIG